MENPETPARVAAFWPYCPTAIGDVARWTDIVSDSGLDRLWLGQSVSVDTASAVSYAAGRGHRCPIGIAVNVIPMTHPLAATQSLRSIAGASGHDVLACFSPGDPMHQERFTGRRYRSPLTATREFLHIVRGLLDNERVRYEGRYFHVDARLPSPPLPAAVRLGIGVLRPRMAQLAGEIADVATSWLTPPPYVRDVLLPALEEGAGRAGRSRPELVVPVHAVLRVEGRDPEMMAEVAIGKHLRTPTYRSLLEQCGQTSLLTKGSSAALDTGLVTYGSPEEIAERIAAVADAGADQIPIVLHQPPMTAAQTAEEWRQVADAAHARLRGAVPLVRPGVPR